MSDIDQEVEVLHARRSVYLAGPMRGLPELNFPAFREAAADLRERGYQVVSPAEMDEELDGFDGKGDAEPLPFATYMARDLPVVCGVDAVVVLPGWQQSRGAQLETLVAEGVGLPVLRYPDLAPARHPSSQKFHAILRALGALHDRKQADYGTDGDPFANVRASEAWGIPAWVGCMVRASDKVKRLQTQAVKGSLANEAATDSFDDLAVYAVIGRVLFEEHS